MDRDRILRLAIEELQRQKTEIEAEIEKIQEELRIVGPFARQTRSVSSTGTRKGRKRNAAERRAQSLRMKRIWAARKKAQAAKRTGAAKARAAGGKIRAKTDAEKKALSLKMKEVWKKRKAEAAKKRRQD